MRKNLPVTQKDFLFPDTDTLMSATDTKGRIIYANSSFVEVSGFDYEELHKKAHNIVRHPDVPPEAYQDLWDTLKEGQSWSAVIKNRRKNGDHYWVRANAVPVYQNNKLSGYISVRTQPRPEDIKAAESTFKDFATGRSRKKYQHGLLLDTGWRRWRNISKCMNVRHALVASTALLTGIWAGISYLISLGVLTPVTGSALGIVATSAIGLWLDFRIVRPLRQVQRQGAQAASGQTVEDWCLNRQDEIASIQRALSQSSLNLRAFVDDVNNQISSLRSASSEIAQGSERLSQQGEAATTNLDNTSGAVGDITNTVQSNADFARDATSLAKESSQAAAQAAEIVGQTAQKMQEMDAATHKISEIVGVIDSIAFQTNILALNAAVEAARAGQQGRGFAVVASEVRALAQRSATSAREITSLIKGVVASTQESASCAVSASDAMSTILDQTNRVQGLINQISDAGTEQADSISRIARAFSQLGGLIQANAEQSAQAVGSISVRTHNLSQAVRVFRQDQLTELPAPSEGDYSDRRMREVA